MPERRHSKLRKVPFLNFFLGPAVVNKAGRWETRRYRNPHKNRVESTISTERTPEFDLWTQSSLDRHGESRASGVQVESAGPNTPRQRGFHRQCPQARSQHWRVAYKKHSPQPGSQHCNDETESARSQHSGSS